MRAAASIRNAAPATVVVYVHGLWFTGREALWLRRRLAKQLAAETCAFSYRSLTATMAETAGRLRAYVAQLEAETVHLVGHSLGGLVILKLFETPPRIAPGRIVLLGSPTNGCRTAEIVARLPGGRKILGPCVEEEVLRRRAHRWAGERDLGIIAGDVSLGLGRLVGRPDGPNDGTVLVAETVLAGATDHRILRVSHSCMLFNREVAEQTAAFLRDGRFAQRES